MTIIPIYWLYYSEIHFLHPILTFLYKLHVKQIVIQITPFSDSF
jgi:hypothetical protein